MLRMVPLPVPGRIGYSHNARSYRLIVEVDGDPIKDQSRDEKRTAWLEARGFRVRRCTISDVMMDLDGVLHHIDVALAAAPHPTVSPNGSGLSDDQ